MPQPPTTGCTDVPISPCGPTSGLPASIQPPALNSSFTEALTQLRGPSHRPLCTHLTCDRLYHPTLAPMLSPGDFAQNNPPCFAFLVKRFADLRSPPHTHTGLCTHKRASAQNAGPTPAPREVTPRPQALAPSFVRLQRQSPLPIGPARRATSSGPPVVPRGAAGRPYLRTRCRSAGSGAHLGGARPSRGGAEASGGTGRHGPQPPPCDRPAPHGPRGPSLLPRGGPMAPPVPRPPPPAARCPPPPAARSGSSGCPTSSRALRYSADARRLRPAPPPLPHAPSPAGSPSPRPRGPCPAPAPPLPPPTRPLPGPRPFPRPSPPPSSLPLPSPFPRPHAPTPSGTPPPLPPPPNSLPLPFPPSPSPGPSHAPPLPLPNLSTWAPGPLVTRPRLPLGPLVPPPRPRALPRRASSFPSPTSCRPAPPAPQHRVPGLPLLELVRSWRSPAGRLGEPLSEGRSALDIAMAVRAVGDPAVRFAGPVPRCPLRAPWILGPRQRVDGRPGPLAGEPLPPSALQVAGWLGHDGPGARGEGRHGEARSSERSRGRGGAGGAAQEE
ncbi:uncharacterized protein LOC135232288 [Loxodonta africana]|uniref:uncharacterized protein LOC135232288 n=1 Tax=Loxodonta africana TaxID=9785 RepID=UPI0030D17E4E